MKIIHECHAKFHVEIHETKYGCVHQKVHDGECVLVCHREEGHHGPHEDVVRWKN